MRIGTCALLAGVMATAAPAWALDDFHFSTGAVNSNIAMASRPDAGGKIEIEAADDFVLGLPTSIDHATFTGLISGTAGTSGIGTVGVEIYRVFPLDSDTVRTIQVPTRANSPSDVAFDTRATSDGNMNFSVTNLGNFTASNSVLNGINIKPNQTTGGEGAVSGIEATFDVTFTTPLLLPAGHYFLVPQVQETGGEFYWLSAERPIVTGTLFSPDLQTWIRNANIDPDWLRVGTDIVGGTTPPTFNGAFTLDGATVPEPASLGLLAVGGLWLLKRRR